MIEQNAARRARPQRQAVYTLDSHSIRCTSRARRFARCVCCVHRAHTARPSRANRCHPWSPEDHHGMGARACHEERARYRRVVVIWVRTRHVGLVPCSDRCVPYALAWGHSIVVGGNDCQVGLRRALGGAMRCDRRCRRCLARAVVARVGHKGWTPVRRPARLRGCVRCTARERGLRPQGGASSICRCDSFDQRR